MSEEEEKAELSEAQIKDIRQKLRDNHSPITYEDTVAPKKNAKGEDIEGKDDVGIAELYQICAVLSGGATYLT